MGKFIDFAYVKTHADFLKVLTHYQIETKGSGEELRCCCPFHDDVNPSMSVNLEKKVFACHADSCGVKGNILEFVEGLESTDLRSAAETLADICKIEVAAPKTGNKKPAAKRRAGQPHDRKGRSKPAKQEPAAKVSKETEPFKPLGFQLQLDPDHGYADKRKLSSWQIETFGMGYCSRGTMKDRWCIPIHDEHGNLVAYTGRAVSNDLPDDVPRWKVPKDFDKSRVIFNFDRVLESKTSAVVLVEGVFDATRLVEDGIPAVALLGSSISEAQVALLKLMPLVSVYVMLDGGADKAQDVVVARLAREALTRSVILPEGEDPASVDFEFLRRTMPGMAPLQDVA